MAVDLPDLRIYQPPGWSGPIVLSGATGTSINACPIVAGNLYLDWAIVNYSSVSISGPPFLVTLLVDGAIIKEWTINSLNAMTYIPLSDFLLPLTVGNHTLKITIDSGGVIAEQNETNNEFLRSVSVLAAGTSGNLAGRSVSYDFGKIPGGRAATKIFTFSNTGPGGLTIETASVAGTDAGAFAISADTCSGKTLPPPDCSGACSSSCTVQVTFSPEQIKDMSATLTVTDSHAVQRQVSLTGAIEPGVGDFNGDGKISTADAVLLLQIMTGGAGNQAIRVQADLDGDSKAGLTDAICVLQLLAKQRQAEFYDLVKIQTNYGNILIWLFEETPLHRDNFLTLARSGYYNGLIFHRVINDFVIQGGDPLGTGSGGPGYTICPEINPALTHNFGAVAAARLADSVNPEKNSSGSQFYIVENSAGTHNLDMNYTVFGKVIAGLDVVTTIADQPTGANDRPLVDVVMEKVEVVTYSAEQLLSIFGFTVGNN